MRSTLLFLLLIPLMRAQVITPNGCFEAIRNCRVAGVGAPYSTVAAGSQADCLALCQADTRCVGVRFGVGFNGAGVCRLYNTLPGTRYPYVPYYRPYNGGFGSGQFGGQFGGGGGRFGGGNGFNGGGRYGGGFGGGGGYYNGGGGYYNGRGGYYNGGNGGGFRGRGNYGGGFRRSLDKGDNLGDPANNTIISQFLRKSSKVDGTVVKGDGGEMIFPENAPPLKGSALSENDIRQVVENAKKEGKPPTLNQAMSRHFSRQPYFYYYQGSSIFRWTGRCPRGGATTVAPFTVAPDTIATVATVATAATTVRLRPSTPATPAPTPPLPARVQCPAGKVAKYLKLENTQLVGLDDFTFTAASLDQCIAACTNNALPDGSQAACLSFDYDRATSVCALSLEALAPAGTGTGGAAPGKDYYEKVCLDATLVEGCTDVLETLPNTILVGFARGVTTEASYADCIQTCLNSQQLFGFRCVSGQFFAEAADQNCVLNEESKNTQPGLINVLDNEAVTYFDFDCQQRRSPLGEPMKLGQAGNILQPGLEAWGPWSYCNKKLNLVTRYRNCLTYNPRSCESESVSCDKKN